MNSFEFYNPVKLIYGKGKVDCIGEEVKFFGKKALIVSYTEVAFYGNLFDRIQDSLKQNNISSVLYFGATANPKICEAEKGIIVGKKENVDMIIGVGGGSAMDLAKVIAAGILYPHDDLRKMIKFSHSKDTHVSPKVALPTIMIPTLPATSSEMNPTAVITDEKTHKKSYVWEPSCLYPKVSILDPELTITLPEYQTACGAVDAISHAVEPFFFSDEKTFGSISLQENMQLAVIKTIYNALPDVLNNPKDTNLRGLMQFSATVGLNGWLTCGVQGWTPMHQMGHVLSSQFAATHGATLACMMLAWMRFFATKEQNTQFKKFSKELFHTEDLLAGANIFEKYLKKAAVQTRISEFGCSEKDLEALTQGVVDVSFSADGTLASIPPITQEEAKRIYELAL